MYNSDLYTHHTQYTHTHGHAKECVNIMTTQELKKECMLEFYSQLYTSTAAQRKLLSPLARGVLLNARQVLELPLSRSPSNHRPKALHGRKHIRPHYNHNPPPSSLLSLLSLLTLLPPLPPPSSLLSLLSLLTLLPPLSPPSSPSSPSSRPHNQLLVVSS